VLIAIALMTLSACGDAKQLDTLEPNARILAFGDSLTFGKGVSTTSAYPSVLEQLSGRTVVNAGVSGETTRVGLNRLPGLLIEHQPALVILFEGGNDILQNFSKTETKANLDQMINEIKTFGAQIILVGVPEKSLFSSSAPWYKELADKHGLLLQDNIVSRLLKKPAMKSDSVHFNAAGYRELAQAIHTLLSDNNAY